MKDRERKVQWGFFQERGIHILSGYKENLETLELKEKEVVLVNREIPNRLQIKPPSLLHPSNEGGAGGCK